MTRPAAPLAGLQNTEVFPEAAKESARSIGMPLDAIRIGRRKAVNTAGVRSYEYVWDNPIRGRIDPLGAVGGSGRLSGDQVDATSTHTATFDADQEVDSNDRIMHVDSGEIFTVNSIRFHSDQSVKQVEVRQLTT